MLMLHLQFVALNLILHFLYLSVFGCLRKLPQCLVAMMNRTFSDFCIMFYFKCKYIFYYDDVIFKFESAVPFKLDSCEKVWFIKHDCSIS